MARYAEGTTVTVESSRGEITGILAKHGVQRMGWSSGPEGDELLFELDGRRYRFSIAKPTMAEIKKMYPNARSWDTKWWDEWRRRWRANVLLIKAKLEFADGELTTAAREFLPYMIVAGAQTLGEWIDTDAAAKLLAAGK